MIELTPEQRLTLDQEERPTVVVNPDTGQEYLLIKREVYNVMCGILKPFGRNWDNPADDDLIRKDL